MRSARAPTVNSSILSSSSAARRTPPTTVRDIGNCMSALTLTKDKDARGHYTIGKELVDVVIDRIRRVAGNKITSDRVSMILTLSQTTALRSKVSSSSTHLEVVLALVLVHSFLNVCLRTTARNRSLNSPFILPHVYPPQSSSHTTPFSRRIALSKTRIAHFWSITRPSTISAAAISTFLVRTMSISTV
jgi:hypothetical protein